LIQSRRFGCDGIGTPRPYSLARLAGVADPDATYSPGAVFLSGVFDSWFERIEYDVKEYKAAKPVESRTVREFLDSLDVDSIACDVSSGRSESIYTVESWRVFVDLALWRENETDWITDRDETRVMNLADIAPALVESVAYRLAESLNSALVDVAAKL
jgi:hypothetical protein